MNWITVHMVFSIRFINVLYVFLLVSHLLNHQRILQMLALLLPVVLPLRLTMDRQLFSVILIERASLSFSFGLK